MRGGILIVNIFAACWAEAALRGAPPWTWPLPIVLSLLLIRFGWKATGGLPPRPPAEEKRAGRWIGFASAGEGVALLLAINILQNIGLREAIPNAFAVIVGLHFLPLAYGLRRTFYYGIGGALVLIGLAALALPASARLPAVGFAAAAILWASAALVMAQAKAGTATA